MGSKQLQVKNWHLREMDWDEKTDTWRYTTLEIKNNIVKIILFLRLCCVRARIWAANCAVGNVFACTFNRKGWQVQAVRAKKTISEP